MEFSKMKNVDSLQLVTTWKVFINDLEAIQEMSFDRVECWSAEDYQNGNFTSLSDSISIDSCILKHLLPLKKTTFWRVFKSNNYNVQVVKRQSEQFGRYCISFPRCDKEEEVSNTFKHYFYFQKVGNKLLFQGYYYNL